MNNIFKDNNVVNIISIMSATTHFDLSTYFDFDKFDDAEYVASKHLTQKSKDAFTIYKYDKKALTSENVDSLGLFRSVCTYDNKVIAVAPPKSASFADFETSYVSEDDFSNLVFEEFVEGTMAIVYYVNGDWEVNTRSLVGARGQFFQGGKTFRRMFLEAMEECSLEFEHLNKEHCYCFAFQHPENRIVVPCTTPKLYLCNVFRIEGTTVTHVDFRFDEALCSHVNVPKRYAGFTNWDSVKRQFASAVDGTVPYYVVGVMVYDKHTMRRTKLRNPTYETVRSLRGNQPKAQYQYYSLRKQGIVKDFLKYYPEYKEEFGKMREQVHSFTTNLHQYYMDCFIFKKKSLKDYPYEYRSHMYMLHKKYLEELMHEKRYVSKYIVMDYINSLEPPRLMYSVNYKLRKQNVDEKSQELEQQPQ